MAAADLQPTTSGLLGAGGRQIFWERFGTGARETVCLLNGLAMHTKAWYPFVPALLDECDVLLYDYPGQGASSFEDAPVEIPEIAGYLARILDHVGLDRVHAVGVSYGGFIAVEFARLHQERLHTLTLSGILLSHERLFEMYEALSLRFYRAGREAFELYTHYMYEKIFGEDFVAATPPDRLDAMRQRFVDRYADRAHALIRLTEAQDPFFEALDANLPGYRSIRTPTLVMPGAEDRAIPPWVQMKICDLLPDARWEPIARSGHVVYLEQPDAFWGTLRRFVKAHHTKF